MQLASNDQISYWFDVIRAAEYDSAPEASVESVEEQLEAIVRSGHTPAPTHQPGQGGTRRGKTGGGKRMI